MNPTGRVDIIEWRAAASDLFTTSKRELPDFMNGQAFKVSVEAVRNTERASRAEVETELGQIATSIKRTTSRKTGKTSFRPKARIIGEDSLAARILAKRFRVTGQWGVKGNTLAERALNLIAARVRSISFIRAGWIGAIRALEPRVFKKPRMTRPDRSVKTYGVLKGGATPARQGIAVATTIFNTALNAEPRPPSGKGNPMPTAERGLATALRIAAADMRAEFERRMQPHFRRVSAK